MAQRNPENPTRRESRERIAAGIRRAENVLKQGKVRNAEMRATFDKERGPWGRKSAGETVSALERSVSRAEALTRERKRQQGVSRTPSDRSAAARKGWQTRKRGK